MNRKRGLSWVGALVLAVTLLVAPSAWAAGPSVHGPGGLWSSVETWLHGLFSDWFGTGVGNSSPDKTYDRASSQKSTDPNGNPKPVGPGDLVTADDGPTTDPDG